MNPKPKAFHHLIKERRRLLNLTQSELAERIGISTSYVSLLEKGQKQPTLGILQRMLRELDINFYSIRLTPLPAQTARIKKITQAINTTSTSSNLKERSHGIHNT